MTNIGVDRYENQILVVVRSVKKLDPVIKELSVEVSRDLTLFSL